VKLALISDLHANLEALDAVLRDIDRDSPDARLVCAGDVVGYGPDPEACIARLQERDALCDEFLDLCTIHGEYDPGEPRLAREFLKRIERGDVGTPTQSEESWR